MLKNLFKSAKKALKNPVVQLGIGALVPGMLPASMGILRNPAVLQGGIGLLAGDKPADVARNIGIQALLGGFRGLGEGGPGFTEGIKRTFETPNERKELLNFLDDNVKDIKKTEDSVVDKVFEAASKIKPETYLGFAEVALPFALAKMAQDNVPQVTPQDIGVGNLDEYNRMLEESRFQNTGGIAGYVKGGEKLTSIGINSLTGEPSGMVTGPGTGKSDSIRFVSSEAKVPTDISNGEFIFTKESTDKIGPENLYALMTSVDKDAETFEEGQERMAMA